MSVLEASNELYNRLKNNDEVIGAGVEKRKDVDYIIIYLTKATKHILDKIPSEYRGARVKTETTGNFSFYKLRRFFGF